MKSLSLKSKITSLLLILVMMLSVFSFVGCKNNNEPQNPEEEIVMEDGVNVVIDIEEFETIYAQASLSQTRFKRVGYGNYTKADVLIVINQIKENIENSTAIQATTNYTYDGYKSEGVAIATLTEKYNYDKQYAKDGKTVVAEYQSWTKPQADGLYYYEIAYEEGDLRKTKHKADPYLNDNAVYDFCQGIFTFTTKTLTEDDIESFKINKNKVYIKINTTIFYDVEGELEVQEIFQVKKGKIVRDKLIMGVVDMNIDYKFNEEVNLSYLNMPNENWVEN